VIQITAERGRLPPQLAREKTAVSKPMSNDLAKLSTLLKQLCEQAVRETDPEKQAKLSAEIYRVVAERDRLRGFSSIQKQT